MPQPLKGRRYWQCMLAEATHVIQGMLLLKKTKHMFPEACCEDCTVGPACARPGNCCCSSLLMVGDVKAVQQGPKWAGDGQVQACAVHGWAEQTNRPQKGPVGADWLQGRWDGPLKGESK